MSSERRAPCPTCSELAAPRQDNPVHPFCSPRCKLADLGRWLDGSYRVPGETVDRTNLEGHDADAKGVS
jgi:endogenous inhibitor of DNA gyrase (YacG/DUF329 family)